MTYIEFQKNLSKKNIDKAYLFTGEEQYLMEKIIANIKKEYVASSFEELNYVEIEGNTVGLDDLINSCETLPFMAEKKIVILKDVQVFLENRADKFFLDLFKYLENLGDHIILVFLDGKNQVKKNTKTYKFFRKENKAINFEKLSDRDLSSWIERVLKEKNKKISKSDLNYFIERSSYKSRNIKVNLYDLENELLKIISYTRNENISREDIDKVIINNIESNIFSLLNSIGMRNMEKALKAFENLYIDDEPIQKIFFMINRQIRLIYMYKLYSKKGYDDYKIQEKIKVKPYEFKNIKNHSMNFNISDLDYIYINLYEMDIRLKTKGIDGKIELELLLAKICIKRTYL